jgi:hypothetical protein
MNPDDSIARELKARVHGDFRYMTGWDAECLREAWREKKAEYNRTYRAKHRERERVMQRIYRERWRARQRGLEPFPLPVWDEEHKSLEVPFE